jgi:ceramide glucosyltransferase
MSVPGFVALGLYVAILVTKVVLARRYMASDNAIFPVAAKRFAKARDSVWWPAPSPARAVPGWIQEPSWSRAGEGAGHHTEPEPLPTACEALPDVTILQPILGGDPALGETLRRNLETVDAQFLWLVDDDDAEGQRVTAELAAAHGRVTILRCPPVSGRTNPKTVKLQRGLDAVTTEYVAVLDDDTLVTQAHLEKAACALQTCTLYTGLPCYLPGTNVWSSLVTNFVNNNSVLTYLPLLPLIAPLTINGMFYVMRSEELRALGGFVSIEEKLCDDYALATLVKRHGGTIRQGVTRQYLRTTVPSAAHYIRLMHRWFLFANTLVRDQTFGVQLLLFVALGLPPLLLWTGFATLSYALPFVLILRHLVIRGLQDRAGGGTSAIVSMLSELLQPLHWLHATLQHTLRWRTRRIVLGADGTFSYLGGPAS